MARIGGGGAVGGNVPGKGSKGKKMKLSIDYVWDSERRDLADQRTSFRRVRKLIWVFPLLPR